MVIQRHMTDRDPLAIRRALMQGKSLSKWALYGLLALTVGNLFGAGVILSRLAGDGLTSILADANRGVTIWMMWWLVMVVVAAICAIAVWRQQSRLAIVIGLFLVAVEWADWALGFSGRSRFTIVGLSTYALITVTLVVGLVGAARYHRFTKIESRADAEAQR
jgi:hypothetical protein